MLQLSKTTNDHILTTNTFINEARAHNKNQDAFIRNLEVQIGQLSKQVSERLPRTFPSDTIVNPKEHCKAIMTRSGKVLPSPEVEEKLDEEEKEKKKEQNVIVEKKHEISPGYVRAMAPYLERFKQDAQKQQYASAIIQKKFPPKLCDPGSFNIPIAIGNTNVGKALCDLGASINLMPLSVCKSLGISELKTIMVSLQLADRSLRKPNEETEMPLLLGRLFLATAWAMIDVEQGKLELRRNDETFTINVFDSMRKSSNKGDCFRLDDLEEVGKEEKSPSQELEARDFVPFEEEKGVVFEVLEKKDSDKEDGAPKVELKELLETLKYTFLGDNETYPVIINKELSYEQERRLIEVLKKHKTAIGWSIYDLKGINLSFCTHKILMKDDVKPVRQPV
ncbi:uncharacterized protein LOC133296035 [Gastrolobium bilobum]|uniref:uncharacterized protein LOC133296035 n=1 Tax=Gastrolobium bilobum TaxID=150636 RepID=UPI002AB264B7|nr:uncharacterized protein LOC133296035 [Gastrolobium bilobum]